MKRIAAAIAASVFVFTVGAALADEQEDGARRFVPVETFTCNYHEGKGPGDLDKVIDAWNRWMDDNDQHDYFAVTLTPHYFGESTFDVGWLGSWPSGEAMGRGTDLWLGAGAKINAQFGQVVDCDTHGNFAVTELKSPGDGPTPDSIVLAFSDCSGPKDAAMWPDLFAGLDAWAKYQSDNGYHEGTWMMFPAYGGGDEEFDFKMVSGWDNHTANGQDYQQYADREDWEKQGELVGALMDCNVPRLYNGKVRRRPAEND